MTDIILGKNTKMSKEKVRRQELRNLFRYAEKVVFKYNPSVRGFQGKIPRHVILQEVIIKIVLALKNFKGTLFSRIYK